MKRTIIAIAILATAAASLPRSACASGRCGQCYNTGKPGYIVVRNGVQDCIPCR